MGSFSDALEPIRAEARKQKAEKEERRKKRQDEGPFLNRLAHCAKIWLQRLIYTAFMVMAIYLIVMCATLFVPTIMAYVLGALGFTVMNVTEVLLSAFSGLFLTLWLFTITKFLCKKIMKIYMINMKKTMSEDAVKRLDELK